MTQSDRTPPLRAVRIEAKCPNCTKRADPKYRPFCSKRCADIDLGRWLKEGYRVPTEESPDDEASEARDDGPDGRDEQRDGQRDGGKGT